MIRIERIATVFAAALLAASAAIPAAAKDKVKVAFIGPLTGGVAANGLGGRNSADRGLGELAAFALHRPASDGCLSNR